MSQILELMYKTTNGQNKDEIFRLMDETRPNRQNDIFNFPGGAATLLTTTDILEKYSKFMDYDGELASIFESRSFLQNVCYFNFLFQILREFLSLYPEGDTFLSKFSGLYVPKIMQYIETNKPDLLKDVDDLSGDEQKLV